ncbi:MAG: ABC transporter ATP-binding protein [Leptolyngbyaceae cyanobacterium bins.59]|nr:ABC transporter ATP-binding protein [Leptolyngbyaceae cyanobacterium bins.59]
MSANQLLVKYALRRPLWAVLTIVFGFTSALFNGISTALIAPVVLGFLDQKFEIQGGPPLIQSLMAPFGSVPERYRMMVMLGAIVFAIVLKNVTVYVSSLISGILTRSLMADLRETGFRLLLEVDLDYYSRMKVGDLINRLGGEIGRTSGAIGSVIQMIINGITALVFIGILLSMSWQLTLIATFLLALVALANQFVVIRSKELGQQLSEMSRVYSSAMIEVLSGIRLVKALANEDREYARLQQFIRQRERIDFQSQANYGLVGPINEVTSIVVIVLIIVLGRILFAGNLQTLSTILLTYLLILFRLLPIVGQLNLQRSQFANAAASVHLVNDFLRREDKPFMQNGTQPFTTLSEGIRFENLSFTYPTNLDRQVLKNINLSLPRGTTLALVGSSGAGKSTLADLLPRFYDPQEGRILVDGVDLRDLDLKSFRRNMGIVSQDTFLFNDTIRNNIAYGRNNPTDEAIIQAAKLANAYEFIEQLPKGLDTLIGDRGVLLSGGQRQRLAIARALLQNPEILILDEATSALDTASERLVQAAIENLSRDRTTLVIAHRLSTIQKAEQIAVLHKGQVVEVGTHEELLRKNGHYAQLHAIQFGDTTDFNQVDQRASEYDALVKTSYRAREQLNIILGSLRLLADDIIDTPDERLELTEVSYHSALQMLNILEVFEESAKTKPGQVTTPVES